MGVVRPLRLVDGHRFREMTNLGGASAEMYLLHQKIAYLYASDPVVTLSVVGSGGNISPTMTDTRYKSGAAVSFTSGNWPQVTQTPTASDASEPEIVTTTYDKVSQAVSDPGAAPTYSIKPVKRDGRQGVREMTEQDILDTFIDPVVDFMETETSDVRAAGSYFVATNTSITNCTNLGTIYSDTRADTSAFTSAGIPSSGYQDHPITVNYQLFRNDGTDPSIFLPLVTDGTDGLREMTNSEFNTYFGQLIKSSIYSRSGFITRYNIDTDGAGSGTTKGTAMTNFRITTVVSSFETDTTRANDYRGQKFPTGASSVQTTYRLKLDRT
tara:strand:+ start:1114 stop:2091 length:978 start_codon:yes stop_codon:yes gene_type:complete